MTKEITDFVAHKNIGFQNFIDSSNLIKEYLPMCRQLINSVFCFDLTCFQNCSAIVFTQPLLSQNYITNKEKKNYINVLENLFALFNRYRIRAIIKMHPGDDRNDYVGFQSQYIKLDEQKNLPAEIILSSVNHKMVISMFSSVSLNNTNRKNQHYWMNKIMDYEVKTVNKIENLRCPISFDEFEKDLVHFVKCTL